VQHVPKAAKTASVVKPLSSAKSMMLPICS
jgi:hypothetical protein